jgi:beta-N-acetylhexosaminidase
MSKTLRTGRFLAAVIAALLIAAIIFSCSVAHGSVAINGNTSRTTDTASNPAGKGLNAVPLRVDENVAHISQGQSRAQPTPGVGNTSGKKDSVSNGQQPEQSPFWSLAGLAEDAAVNNLMEKMGPEERLGQVFMLSYEGDEPTPLLYSWIRRRGLGGVKIFGWNTEDTGRLANAVNAIQSAAAAGSFDVPPFIATDQEGGWIRHVKGRTSVTPGNMAIGASAWPSDSYRSAYYIGRELAALGITMNFAPTVDLATRPASKIIGPRAFSSDPMDTGILAAAWVRGMADAGIVAMAKHYPGHGDTELDSHGVLPIINIDEDTLWNRELVPYRLLAAEGLPGVMTGHLAFPGITGSREPASLSTYLITTLLRDRMGYDGLVITDDLLMTGAASPGGLAETAERALRAGNDILMFSTTLGLNDAVWGRLISLYKSDAPFRARVDESTRRVLRAKVRWLLPMGAKGVFADKSPERSLRTEESVAFFQDQAVRSTTLVKNTGLPSPADGHMVVAGPFGEFIAEAQARFPGTDPFRYSYQSDDVPLEPELAAFNWKLSRADSAIVCVANPAGVAYARAVRKAGKRLYVVSALNPSHALEFAEYATVVAVYSYSRESFRAAFAVLGGDVEAPGRLPIGMKP